MKWEHLFLIGFPWTRKNYFSSYNPCTKLIMIHAFRIPTILFQLIYEQHDDYISISIRQDIKTSKVLISYPQCPKRREQRNTIVGKGFMTMAFLHYLIRKAMTSSQCKSSKLMKQNCKFAATMRNNRRDMK